MKTTLTLIAIWLMVTISLSQSISPEVIASSGDYYEGTNTSLSWTLGELSTETYSVGNVILTQGFQQPIILELTVDLKAFLSGPFNGSDMNTDLNNGGLLPLSQPYNTDPWMYFGIDSVNAIPNPDVVDWLLIELRDATDAESAGSDKRVTRKAAFLLNDGSIVDLDGTSNVLFHKSVSQGLFVVLWHRNHVNIMSTAPLIETGGVYTYDFTTDESMVYGGSTGYTELSGGSWGMVGGDGNSSGGVENTDKVFTWTSDAGKSGYLSGDYNMNSQANNPDKNDVWYKNYGKISLVPE